MNQPGSNSKKSIIIGIIVVVIAALVYFAMTGDDLPEEALFSEVYSPEVEVSSAKIISLLNQIEDLRIDASIFQNPAYQTLEDYSVEIPPQNVGRSDPFAPVPGLSAGNN